MTKRRDSTRIKAVRDASGKLTLEGFGEEGVIAAAIVLVGLVAMIAPPLLFGLTGLGAAVYCFVVMLLILGILAWRWKYLLDRRMKED